MTSATPPFILYYYMTIYGNIRDTDSVVSVHKVSVNNTVTSLESAFVYFTDQFFQYLFPAIRLLDFKFSQLESTICFDRHTELEYYYID